MVAITVTRATSCTGLLPPTVAANIPTQVPGAQSNSKFLDLTAYMQPGWTVENVSVANPGAASGVGPPVASISGTVITLSLPDFYGDFASISTTWRFRNAAGVSPTFAINFLNMVN